MSTEINIRKFVRDLLLYCLLSVFMMILGTYAGHLMEVTEPLLIGLFVVMMVGFANILLRLDYG